MSRQNGVLEMAHGNEYLTLPGPGGYTINWSPGTIRYKLEKAMSGHLLLPCDEFGRVSKNVGGLEEPKMTFYGTHHVKMTRGMGTQTDDVETPKSTRVTNNRKHPKNS